MNEESKGHDPSMEKFSTGDETKTNVQEAGIGVEPTQRDYALASQTIDEMGSDMARIKEIAEAQSKFGAGLDTATMAVVRRISALTNTAPAAGRVLLAALENATSKYPQGGSVKENFQQMVDTYHQSKGSLDANPFLHSAKEALEMMEKKTQK